MMETKANAAHSGSLSAAALSDRVSFQSWPEALAAPVSRHFGIAADGAAKHARGYYRTDSADNRRITFDISNNRISASPNRRGSLQNAAIATGLEFSKHAATELRGVIARKQLAEGGPWHFGLRLADGQKVLFHETGNVGVELLGRFFPMFTARHQDLALRLLAFAPVDDPARDSPRAIIQVLELAHEGGKEVSGTVSVEGNPQKLKDGNAPLTDDAREAVVLLDGGAWAPSFPEIRFKLAAGERRLLACAFLLGESAAELEATIRQLRRRTSLAWFNSTWNYHAARLGRLSIPEDSFREEVFVRLSELCRQAAIYLGNGQFGGSFISSEFGGIAPWSQNIWIKDCFYQLLPLSMFAPRLCADSIPFFLKWGLTTKAYGRGLDRFPGAGPEIHSLSLTLAPFVLAGEYYRLTGDRAFFTAHPEILAEAQARFQKLLAGRKDKEIFLFNSMYISDGDARGEFHTGSNLLAWHAFANLARLARDVYAKPGLAQEWRGIADRIRTDIQNRCAGAAPEGRRYFEGVEADGAFVAGHDGEESDVGLMPFYGFAEADDPAMQLHSRLALTDQNPLYAPGVDGVWWFDERWYPTTFPAWITALAGATDEAQLRQGLDKIERLTDVDGSIWWWPHEYQGKDQQAVKRHCFKSSWAAGAYLCRFVNDILGLRVDVPAKKFAFRPFCPWRAFSWRNCRLGSALFHVACQHEHGRLAARIENGNAEAYAVAVELVLPPGAEIGECRRDGKPTRNFQATRRHGRPAVRFELGLQPAQTTILEV